MKTLHRILSVILLVSIVACISMPVNAMTSTVYVSAGGSAFTDEHVQAFGSSSKCHMSLSYVHFTNYPENTIPSSYYVHSRLYEKDNHNAEASHLASFSQVSSSGYDYDFNSGYATSGQQFVLKTNSNLAIYYSATFIYSAYAWS